MQTITYEMALRALNEAVKAKGHDYVYPRAWQSGGCYNVTLDGEPDCIVGWALVWLGVPGEWFLQDTGRRDAGATTACNLLRMEGIFDVTHEAAEFFSQVQRRQDRGASWGEAVTMSHLSRAVFEAMGLRAGRVLEKS
jgi:hypothetical protein